MTTERMNARQLDSEREMILELARLVDAGKVSPRLTQHRDVFGKGSIDRLLDCTYWELGYGRLSDPERKGAIMTIGMNPSENQLHPEASQPWGMMPLNARIERWRMCDAWTLGIEERSGFEHMNGGLDFGKQNTWAYFQRLRRLFRAAGYEDRLRSSYNTNISKFTSPNIKSIQKDFEAEVDACIPTLTKQLRLVAPEVVVVIGVDTLGSSRNKAGIQKLFYRQGGTLALTRTPYASGKRQYQSGTGILPGISKPMKVIVLPHTSGYAHVNFDPYFDDLTRLVQQELQAVYS